MKTFFIAFLLGIFVGVLAMGYFAKPGAYKGALPNSWTREQNEQKPEPESRPSKEADDESAAASLREKAGEAYDGAKEMANEWSEKAKTTGQAALEASKETGIGVKIRAKFKLDDDLRGAAIDISVEDGRVTLVGQVPSREVEQKAISKAIETGGVKEVVSRLEIAEKQAP